MPEKMPLLEGVAKFSQLLSLLDSIRLRGDEILDRVLYFLFIAVFSGLTWRFRFNIYLGDLTGIQKLATLFTVAAGVAAIVAIITKFVGDIVGLFPEALKRAVEAGRREQDALWADWLARREEAQRKGQPFQEPPPNSRRRN